MFDQLAPTAEQEEEGLHRLLQTERKVTPMKRLQKWMAAGIAAALMVVSCAAAAVTGMDQRLLDFMGWGGQDQELLAPGAVPLDIVVEDNGSTLCLTQMLVDRCTVLIMADFTAPEGTVLDVVDYSDRWARVGFGDPSSWSDSTKLFMDKNGEFLDLNSSFDLGFHVLEDGDPSDNHLSLAYTMNTAKSIDLGQATFFWLSAVNLTAFDRELGEDVILCYGDWSAAIPMPQDETGWTQRVDSEGIEEVYLSPMTLQLYVDRAVSHDIDRMLADNNIDISTAEDAWITLTTGDGETIALHFALGSSPDWQVNCAYNFRLTEITNPARFQGGTLCLHAGDVNVELPLDNLIPAEEWNLSSPEAGRA